MSNRRKNRVQESLKNIRNGSEAKKARLTWFLVILFMLGILFLWVCGAQKNFSQMASSRLVDLSGLPSFPDDGIADVDLGGALKSGGEKLNEYLAEDKAHWQGIGDQYIKEKNILVADDFSSLKFVDSWEENGAIAVEYVQYYKDVPVWGRGLVLFVSPNANSVVKSSDNLVTGVDLTVDPEIPLKTAIAIAQKEAGTGTYIFTEGTLVVVIYEEKPYLAWKIVLASGEGVDTKDVLVGAQRGNIIPMDAVLLENEKGNQTSDIVEDITNN